MDNSENKIKALKRISDLQAEIDDNSIKGISSVELWDEMDMLHDILREMRNNEPSTIG